MTERLMRATGVEDAINLLVWLILLLTLIVLVAIVIYVWAKFHTLPGTLKFFLVAVFLIAVAYSAGLWTPQGVAKAWESLKVVALDTWRRFDGYTRTNRTLGVMFLALLVPLMALQGSEEA